MLGMLEEYRSIQLFLYNSMSIIFMGTTKFIEVIQVIKFNVRKGRIASILWLKAPT